MNGLLASNGWGDELFFTALAMLAVVATGTVCGIAGTLYGLFRPNEKKGLPVALGLLGLITVFGYAAAFWIENGDGSWEHAGRHPIFHAVCVGLAFLSSISAIVLGVRRRRQPS